MLTQCFRLAGCLSVLLVTGCASSGNWLTDYFSVNGDKQPVEQQRTPEPTPVMVDSGLRYRSDSRDQASHSGTEQGVALWQTPKQLYHPRFTHKSLAGYAEQLTMGLMQNHQVLRVQGKVAVATFVSFDAQLNQASLLGNQLAEHCLTEIQQFGVTAVDFKLMDAIRVNRQGDFVFSRDARDLADELEIDYVLTGTLMEDEKGVQVNARIISQQDKSVVSSASVFIPHFIVGELYPRYSVGQ